MLIYGWGLVGSLVICINDCRVMGLDIKLFVYDFSYLDLILYVLWRFETILNKIVEDNV